MTLKQWASALVTVAFIGAIALIATAWLATGKDEDPVLDDATPGIILKLENVLAQRVNKYAWHGEKLPDIPEDLLQRLQIGKEQATFRFVVTNHRATAAAITGGCIVIGDVPKLEIRRAARTRETIPLMDHRGHLAATVQQPNTGDEIPMSVTQKLAPGESRELVVWIRSNNSKSLVVFDARLRLNLGDERLTSEPFQVEIHPKTNTFSGK